VRTAIDRDWVVTGMLIGCHQFYLGRGDLVHEACQAIDARVFII
jgi:hypothetical protein